MQLQALFGKYFTRDIRIPGCNECFGILQLFRLDRDLNTATAGTFQRIFTELVDQMSAINDGII